MSNPIPQRSQIFIVERQFANFFIKLDRMLKTSFRFLKATSDTCVAGQVESNHGNLGMNGLRPEQNGFCLVNAFGAPNRIGKTDPPAGVFRLNLYQMAGNRDGHVPFLGCHVEINTRPEDFVAGLSFGAISSKLVPPRRTFRAQDTCLKQGRWSYFPAGF